MEGRFAKEIVGLEGHDASSARFFYDYDEVIRPETTVDTLSQLRPVFDPVNGTVTAGTSSALSDGAAAMLVMSADRQGPRPHARAPGCAPWPSPAVTPPSWVTARCRPPRKRSSGPVLTIGDIDLFELNEAFAAQSLPCVKDLGLQGSGGREVNLNGGAIALGHPLGCSGARISTTLINLMEERTPPWESPPCASAWVRASPPCSNGCK